MSEPALIDSADYVSSLGKSWLSEVAKLRKEASDAVPEHDASPGQVYHALLAVRGALDRVEEILAQAMAMRSGAEASAREKAELAADELDKEVSERRARARDYEAAQERLADARLSSLGYARRARAAQKLADQAASIESRIRLAHRGLDSTRGDLIAALRHVSWESSVDR